MAKAEHYVMSAQSVADVNAAVDGAGNPIPKPLGRATTRSGGELTHHVLSREELKFLATEIASQISRIEPRYLSIDEAADYAGYTPDALRKHIQRGHLHASKEGCSTRVDRLEIDKWMLKNRD